MSLIINWVAVVVGKTVIYFVSQVLEPPERVFQVALSDLRLSTWVASIYASELDRNLSDTPGVTFLAPTNAAFNYLGLARNYLLLPSSKSEAEAVVKYHALDEVVYLNDFGRGSRRYPTLEGTEIYIERTQNDTFLHGPDYKGFPINGDIRDGRIVSGDMLTSTGALHVVDQVELPPSVKITINKLMRGAKASTMSDLLRLTNMSWIAEGTDPPEDFVLAKGKKGIDKRPFQHRSYTLLCPTDHAFSRINLTRYLDDPVALEELVRLHIIPSPPPSKSSIEDPSRFPSDGRPLTLADEAAYSTLLSAKEGGGSKYGDVVFRHSGNDHWLVGIKGARGTDAQHDWASVTGFGRASPRFFDSEPSGGEDEEQGGEVSTQKLPRMVYGGGLLLVDAVLLPYEPDWFARWGWIVVVVILSLACTACVGLLTWKVIFWKRKERSEYQALENEEDS
jgi:solute carrier family 25 carnitine/acylcarnitine transporter 20/29